MNDDEVIKRRLLIDGDGTGESRAMSKFTKSFVKWCPSEDTAVENQVQYDRLMAQLASIEYTSVKWSNVIQMNNEEVQHYSEAKDLTSAGVESAMNAINGTKKDLIKARQIRKNRMEYDALARLIKEHPPRSDTANKLTLLNHELASLKTKKEQLEQKLSVRRKQFHTLITAIHQIEETLKSDPIDTDTIIDITDDSMDLS